MSSENDAEPESELPRSIGRTARRVLALAGYTRLTQCAAVSEAELLRLHGVGPKATRLLREALAAQGLAFAARAADHESSSGTA
jgi:predicted flap endonuclease-1-like 5' DNA nuclease